RLEGYRHRNTADRIAVLIRLHLMAESKNQKVQAATLAIEIEKELSELFGVRFIDPPDVAMQPSRLFRIQGKNIAADAFLIYAEREYRRGRDMDSLVDLFEKRAAVLLEANQKQEAGKLEKKARRLKRRPSRDVKRR